VSENWSLTLKEGRHTVRVYVNRMPKRIFKQNIEEIIKKPVEKYKIKSSIV